MPSSSIDTVIVGSGPSALILSFILSGHVPSLRPSVPHPDPQLQAKLAEISSLFDVDVQQLTSHFYASRFSYSTQALPANTLFDTLIRPLADTEPGLPESCIEWCRSETRVPHVVLGSSKAAGGQWQESPVEASWDIGALSYADLLSLPGYSIEEHLRKARGDVSVEFLRPSRQDVAGYFAAYPKAVGIDGFIRDSNVVSGVRRTDEGFYIGSHDIHCRHLVLASGTFSSLIPARLQLQPLLHLPLEPDCEAPLLVVGSGFSAADLIITHLPKRKIIHIFKWDPIDCVSPLRACHPQAYPEYAAVYRRMKLAAATSLGDSANNSPMARRKSNPFFDGPELERNYEGLPNTYIKDISIHGNTGSVSLELSNGQILRREVSGLQYVIGRRGSLAYLDYELRKDVLGPDSPSLKSGDMISGQTLRAAVEESIEVAPEVFAIGSLVGDSLIRHAYGSCIMAAGKIINRQTPKSNGVIRKSPPTAIKSSLQVVKTEYVLTNGHEHLGVSPREVSASEDDLDKKPGKKAAWYGSCVMV